MLTENYTVYNMLYRVLERIKRKHFQLGKVEHPNLSAKYTGIAGTSAPSPQAHKNYLIYSMLYRMLDRIKIK